MPLRVLGLTALIAVLMVGCTAGHGSVRAIQGMGLIYSHTYEPLMINAHATKTSGGSNSSGTVKYLQLQYVSVAWSDNAIGDIARAAGIETVHFADVETLRVLTFWETQTVHIYGEAGSALSSGPAPAPDAALIPSTP